MLDITNYILSAMLTFSPLANHRGAIHTNQSNEEKDSYTEARYESISADINDVVDEEDSIFYGVAGKVQTAMLITAISSYESGGFDQKVDDLIKRGDSGRSYCIMQVALRDGETIHNRKDCIRIGLGRIRESFAACKGYQKEWKLAAYASGHCERGHNAASLRFNRAINWMKEHQYFILDNQNPPLFEIM
jgi:hypothetical protein